MPDNSNLKGLKEVLSWFIDDQSQQNEILQKKNQCVESQKESRRSRKIRTNKIFTSLPKPPKLSYKKRSNKEKKVYKRQVKKSWENTLNETQLKRWNTLSANEQHTYLFRTDSEVIGMIKRGKINEEEDNGWWNDKQTDWDIT